MPKKAQVNHSPSECTSQRFSGTFAKRWFVRTKKIRRNRNIWVYIIVEMNPKRNKKLCHNCDGEIDKDALFCLYCGTDLSTQPQDVPPPPYTAQAKEQIVPQEKPKSGALPLALLVPGAVFFVFSLFMLFFSNGDTLILEWDASYWFIYLLVSLPLLYLGVRLLKD